MSFFQKIYFNNKPFILSQSASFDSAYNKFEQLKGASAENFKEAIKLLQAHDCVGVILIDSNRESLEKELLWAFYPIHSGGGVVENEQGEILMIFRRGKWDLPKGKLDEGEDIEQCALREVREETGLKNVTLQHKICNTMHIYSMNNSFVLKYTSWYKMKGSSSEILIPQAEEKIEQAKWVNPKLINSLLTNSFETIGDVIKEANIL